MPVQWSSMYVMLHRAEELKEHVDQFVSDMVRAEKDCAKRQKLDDLQLSSDEWEHVKNCLDLLLHADHAQQVFSSEEGPSLHLALPALEAIQRAWLTRSDCPKYVVFASALEAGCAKIKEYFEKTADSEVYMLALLLDPAQKLSYIRKSWGKELLAEARAHAEEIYKAQYLEMYGSDGQTPAPSRPAYSGQAPSAQATPVPDSDSDDDEPESEPEPDASAVAKPWLKDFNGYLDSTDDLGKLSIKNVYKYPVWASLAHDYLSVMALSVSSERAFSSAGITISKRCNCLKADIVEALQRLKSCFHHNILFREMPSSLTECDDQIPAVALDLPDTQSADTTEEDPGWDVDEETEVFGICELNDLVVMLL
ncbi:uncharacterized protein TRAVEDRAFT_135389 [Trametes versicolor FP-101664 SS1]|uniref:uncharacterized protein n=1 Tax=Trametes versicolor (strain FP-101664) TaxID=717944 RepID=UPI00046243A0|nr:uncharacterized protein TRAVEDRAFT_135389 [Trametes versicolor FP-101664 SS1]EIW52842.1 hypothetical protein TRAVEDRAFT_135389 [Trametes versicolor FP-101664 SS1]